ncbi:MAG: hypothetical protein PHS41_09970 [Victivallaceae bacterium]|nr:hypothetical protein [Victivallaceae bacterium]
MVLLQLDGSWSLSGSLSGEKALTLEACVPENIETTLFRGKMVEDPFLDLNAMKLRKYEFYDWCYEKRFTLDHVPERCELVFDGVDVFAEYELNGIPVGQSSDAFLTHRFDVSKVAKTGENLLRVTLRSANNQVREKSLEAAAFSSYPFNYESIFVRRPAHEWGWDIAPRLALGGIFGSVRLEEIPAYRVEEAFLQTLSVGEDSAQIMVTYKVAIPDAVIEGYTLEVSGVCRNSSFEMKTDLWSCYGVLRTSVMHPELWFPRHYGDANLYEVSVTLRKNNVSVAQKSFHVGLRTVKLEAKPLVSKSATPDFQFVVNQIPVQILGTNHVPLDALHGNDRNREPLFFKLLDESNCNLIRIWGGGHYESDSFYDRCDQMGILIWHDFMMGCANYPQSADFASVIETEATSAVRRLRQHPSIALWAGDNECDCVPSWAGLKLDANRNRLTREVLPEIVRRWDPTRSYLPSSPWYSTAAVEAAGPGGDPASYAPEQHLWGPRDFFRSDFYRNTSASFASEIGYHGCPGVSSIRKFITEGAIWPAENNKYWDYHASNPFLSSNDTLNYRTYLMLDQVREMFGSVPKSIERFAAASQFCQAEACKFFIELVRSREKMSGLVWWNLIDCWPQFSDAVVDYYGNRKLAYHIIRRSQEPVLLMVTDAKDWMHTVVVNNISNQAVAGHYVVRSFDENKVLIEGDFQAQSNAKKKLAAFKVCTTEQRLLLIEWTLADGRRGINHLLAGQPQFDMDVVLDEYLPAIAALDGSFDPADVAQ